MRWVLLAAITMLATLIRVPEGVAQAVPFPTLYDDFRGAQIDPARWAPIARGYEMSINQEEGQLGMTLQAYGNVGSPAPPPDDPQGLIEDPVADSNLPKMRDPKKGRICLRLQRGKPAGDSEKGVRST